MSIQTTRWEGLIELHEGVLRHKLSNAMIPSQSTPGIRFRLLPVKHTVWYSVLSKCAWFSAVSKLWVVELVQTSARRVYIIFLSQT